LPAVSGGADASRRGSVPQGGGAWSFSDSFGLSLSASYELDFWGRNRDAVVSAQAARKATAADRATVALTTVSSTANTYFQLLSLRARLTIARLNLENAQAVLQITQARVNDGIATPLELAQQLATVASQQASIPPLQQQELAARDALAVLTGRPPEGFAVAGQDLDAVVAPQVAPGLTSDLLARRPDIVTAEANLEGAHADLAAARAAFFPSISLTGDGGLTSATLVKLLTDPAATLAFGASLSQTIFDGGARAAQTDQAIAREQELLANYRGTVIGAFSDVETALGNIGHLAEQERYQTEQANQSQRAFGITEARYREGVADYLTLLDAQRTLYQSRDQLSQIKLARLQALVALYQALGGGWREEDLAADSPPR
jgi:NodT family efflux transporter outer membrane factor (OMF) lipoprotein